MKAKSEATYYHPLVSELKGVTSPSKLGELFSYHKGINKKQTMLTMKAKSEAT